VSTFPLTACWSSQIVQKSSMTSKMGLKILWQNFHMLLNSCLDIITVARNHATKYPQFAEKLDGHYQHVKKILWQNVHILLNSRQDITNGSKNHVTNRPNFTSGKGDHDVTEHFEEGGHHVRCDKLSTLKPGWMKNTWMDRTGVRMSGVNFHSRWFVG
jgi:hypothetical protein